MARKRIVRRRRADEDVDGQVSYYLEQGDFDTALRFLDAVDSACRRLQEHPEIGPARSFKNPQLAGLRVWFLPDFDQHLVFYRVAEDTVEIVRILHAKRDIGAILEEND